MRHKEGKGEDELNQDCYDANLSQSALPRVTMGEQCLQIIPLWGGYYGGLSGLSSGQLPWRVEAAASPLPHSQALQLALASWPVHKTSGTRLTAAVCYLTCVNSSRV